MNEELLALLAKMQTGTATQEEIVRYTAMLNGGASVPNSAYQNRNLTPPSNEVMPAINFNQSAFGINYTPDLNNRTGFNFARNAARDRQPIPTEQDKVNETLSKIANGTATPKEIADYQEWATIQNDKFSSTYFDTTYGSSLLPNQQSATGDVFMSEADLLAQEQKDAQAFFDEQMQKDIVDGKIKAPTTQTNQNQLTEFKLPNTPFPLIYPGGSDLSTELYTLGRAIGAKPGSQGRALTGIGAAGAALMDVGRNVASGIGFEKRNQYIEDWLRQNKDKINFTPNSQTRDTKQKYGGTFRIGTFEEGGTSDMQPQMEQPQFQSEQQIQQEQPQQDQAGQMMQAVAQMLQQGATPQQAVQALVQQGVPQEQAIQIVQMVAQQMQQMMAQQQPQQQQAPQQQPQPEMVMKNGGLFDRKIGDIVTIKTSNGEKVTGKIKSIVNGKVILE